MDVSGSDMQKSLADEQAEAAANGREEKLEGQHFEYFNLTCILTIPGFADCLCCVI